MEQTADSDYASSSQNKTQTKDHLSVFVTSSLSVLSSFWAAAAAALGTWLTVGLEAMRTGVLGRMSGGIRPGDTGLR